MKKLLAHLTSSARRQAPWWLLGATGVAVVPVLAAGAPALDFWRATLVVTAVIAALISRFANRNPAAYGIIVLAGVVHLTVSSPIGTFETPTSVPRVDAIADLREPGNERGHHESVDEELDSDREQRSIVPGLWPDRTRSVAHQTSSSTRTV